MKSVWNKEFEKNMLAARGIEPRSPVWQTGIIPTRPDSVL